VLNWKHSPQHPKIIAYIPFREGYLARVEFDDRVNTWNISLFSGTIRFTRDREITQIEEVKKLAEQSIRSGLKELEREFDKSEYSS
jgi:hypothetical protein